MRGESKKVLVLTIIIMFFIMSFSSVQAKHLPYTNEDRDTILGAIRGDKKWTFMAYLDGDYNDLQSDMFGIINNMELVGSTSDINIVAQADDYDGWGGQTRRYYIEHDSNPIENDRNSENITSSLADTDTVEKNSGDAQTIVDFVCWAIDNYPADYYSLAVFDHGLGWKGICYDQTSNFESIDMNDLKYAMTMIYNHLGRTLDILILDACMMGMIEVLYPIREYVSFVVSPEDRIAFETISFKGILENLTDQPLVTPLQFVQEIVDTSYDEMNEIRAHEFFGIDMDKIGTITEGINEFAQALRSNMPPRFMIRDAYSYSLVWEGGTSPAQPHDIIRFAEKISDSVYNNGIKNKANELMNIINDSVIRPREGENDYVDPRFNGVAIYFPPYGKDFDVAYMELEFSGNSQWDEFLSSYYSLARGITHQTMLSKLSVLKNLKIVKIIKDIQPLVVSVINYYEKICKGDCLTFSIALKNELYSNPYCQYLIEQEIWLNKN